MKTANHFTFQKIVIGNVLLLVILGKDLNKKIKIHDIS